MTFKAVLSCDGLGCHNTKEMDASHPSDAEVEYYNDDEWENDAEGSDYCPSCWVQIQREIDPDDDRQ